MPYLHATDKARKAIGIGRGVLASAPHSSNATLGDWMVNVVPIGHREAFLFMSTSSLLSFPIFIGRLEPTLEDVPGFLSHGVTHLIQIMGASDPKASRLRREFEEIAVCKATDKSLLGVFSAVAADYFYRVEHMGGLARADLDAVAAEVNSMPRATLGWQSSLEVGRVLIGGLA
jgi:hypothetical protein